MPFIDRPNYLPVDLKPFQGMDAQHLNHVLCELISHKKIIVKIWFFLLQTTKRSSVVWLTPKLNSGLKNYNFLQNIFSFGLENPLMLPVTIYFCKFVQPEWIFYFKTFSCLSSNNTPGGVSTC